MITCADCKSEKPASRVRRIVAGRMAWVCQGCAFGRQTLYAKLTLGPRRMQRYPSLVLSPELSPWRRTLVDGVWLVSHQSKPGHVLAPTNPELYNWPSRSRSKSVRGVPGNSWTSSKATCP